MRFVDEFRDPALARRLAREIAALCEPGRRYKFMEVCGGITHTGHPGPCTSVIASGR